MTGISKKFKLVYYHMNLHMLIQFHCRILSFQSFLMIFESFELPDSPLSIPIKNIKFRQLRQKIQCNFVIDIFIMSEYCCFVHYSYHITIIPTYLEEYFFLSVNCCACFLIRSNHDIVGSAGWWLVRCLVLQVPG